MVCSNNDDHTNELLLSQFSIRSRRKTLGENVCMCILRHKHTHTRVYYHRITEYSKLEGSLGAAQVSRILIFIISIDETNSLFYF